MRFQLLSSCWLLHSVFVFGQLVGDGPQGFASLNGGCVFPENTEGGNSLFFSTNGGAGGSTVRVSSFAELSAAAKGNDRKVIIVSGTIRNGGRINVGSNKTIRGARGATLVGTGLQIKNSRNIIVQNLKIQKVKADAGDAIGIQRSTNIWIDHCDLSSDLNNGKDFYDGLIDITHAGDYITVSNTKFHEHFKASLVGHSDNNGAEDRGKLRVTYHNNYWSNINSRAPSLRFGTGHVYNSLFVNVKMGINTRQRAQVLVENNVFVNSSRPLYSTDGGFAVQHNNEFGSGGNAAPAGTLNRMPYAARLDSPGQVRALAQSAGATLNF